MSGDLDWFEKRQRVLSPAPFDRQWSVEEKESILDYLHGEIPDPEVKACCYYEYARASETLRKARRAYDPADPENSSLKVSNYFPGWVTGWPAAAVWTCHNYPAAPWRELSDTERENIRPHFGKISPSSVVTDVLKLKGMGVFDSLMKQAENELIEFNERLQNSKPFIFPRGIRAAIASGVQPCIKHVIITINYMDGIDAVKGEFARWLGSEPNRKLFNDYYKRPIPRRDPDLPDHYKELLKFLAAWRLYDERGVEDAKDWTQKNRRQDQQPKVERIKHRAFFREKPEKTTEADKQHFGPQFFGPLYRDRRDWEKAVAKAKSFLASEFGTPGVVT